MFRKMAIALLAASVFTAPVLAQNNTLSGGTNTNTSKNAPSNTTPTTAPTGESTEKAEKPETAEKPAESKEKTAKRATHHRHVARHHHRGTKAAKLGRTRTGMAMYGRHHGARAAKYAKYEGRRSGHHHGRAYGRGSKHMLSRPSAD